MSNYYEDQIAKVLPADKYGIKIKLSRESDTEGKTAHTNWLTLTPECRKALRGMLDQLDREAVEEWCSIETSTEGD